MNIEIVPMDRRTLFDDEAFAVHVAMKEQEKARGSGKPLVYSLVDTGSAWAISVKGSHTNMHLGFVFTGELIATAPEPVGEDELAVAQLFDTHL